MSNMTSQDFEFCGFHKNEKVCTSLEQNINFNSNKTLGATL